MSDKKQPCPNCKKKIAEIDCNFEWHKKGRKGKCPKCGKSLILTTAARGIVKDKNGVAHKRFRNS